MTAVHDNYSMGSGSWMYSSLDTYYPKKNSHEPWLFYNCYLLSRTRRNSIISSLHSLFAVRAEAFPDSDNRFGQLTRIYDVIPIFITRGTQSSSSWHYEKNVDRSRQSVTLRLKRICGSTILPSTQKNERSKSHCLSLSRLFSILFDV